MFRAVPRAALFLVAGLLAATPARAQDGGAPLFRVFLSDGTALASYGEWARTRDRVVFSLPLGAAADAELRLVTLPADKVDWPRTQAYRDRVRAVHYAATRGQADFDALSSEVARTLNEIALEADPTARLKRAEQARRALADWPRAHYGYKAREIQEFVGTLDAIIGDLRAANGQGRFDLALTSAAVPSAEPLLPAPGTQEIADQLLAAASLGATAVERKSLLETVLSLLDRTVEALPEAWSARVRKTALGRLADEERTGSAYAALRASTMAEASRYAAEADVRALGRLRARTVSRDAALGRKRPDEVVAVLAAVDAKLADARRLRLALDQWELRSASYTKYQRAVRSPLAALGEAAASLEAIRAMAGPSPGLLQDLAGRLDKQTSRLAQVAPPAGLAPVHAIIRSAWELAVGAVRLRLDAVRMNDLDGARQASAAAAGALMLLDRARSDLRTAVERPHLP